jgi:hypothetical protein
MSKYLWLTALLAGAWAPGRAATHPNLSGTWALDTSHSEIHDSKLKSETLAIQQQEDAVKMAEDTNEGGKAKKLQFQCLADGSSCKANDGSVMVYYNGPELIVVEMRHNNSNVIKKRLKPSDDGKTLSMDVIHIAPEGQKNETLTFVKQN